MSWSEYMLGSDGKNHFVIDTDTEIVPLCAMVGFGPDKFWHIEKDISVFQINCVDCLQYAIDLMGSSDREV